MKNLENADKVDLNFKYTKHQQYRFERLILLSVIYFISITILLYHCYLIAVSKGGNLHIKKFQLVF